MVAYNLFYQLYGFEDSACNKCILLVHMANIFCNLFCINLLINVMFKQLRFLNTKTKLPVSIIVAVILVQL